MQAPTLDHSYAQKCQGTTRIPLPRGRARSVRGSAPRAEPFKVASVVQMEYMPFAFCTKRDEPTGHSAIMSPMPDTSTDWKSLSRRLVAALKPTGAPVAISFHAPGETPPAERVTPDYPEPNERGTDGTGPGRLRLLDAWCGADVRDRGGGPRELQRRQLHAWLPDAGGGGREGRRRGGAREAGWVDQAAVMGLPHVAERPGSVVYGPAGGMRRRARRSAASGSTASR